ncbi:hypothetical protein DSO57_1012612 [Entomophthora muscae]|uniref:Uncharacterized protein n=1 Tax=Entomophthora muscae TaxID=34485 RepID=A0ACC2RKR0_9FUNG|nr:hypothetical protein DSO57_1012612 [Entomophthora muscae]
MKYPPFDIAIRLVHNVRYVKGRLIERPLCISSNRVAREIVITLGNQGIDPSVKSGLSLRAPFYSIVNPVLKEMISWERE